MKQARAHVRKGHLDLPDDAELLVVVEHICNRPKSTTRYYPQGDVDNFAKASLDVVTKATGWWHDDDQLTYLLTTKRFAKSGEQSRTTVEIYRP
jgi:Holliday junction resolvase RusA-like endonuclease